MSVLHLDLEISKPSEILSRSAITRVAHLWKDYMPFGKEAMLDVAVELHG
jgi:hypothetical protein